MSMYVYIAREGFKETPIDMDTWLSAARSVEELVVEELANRLGEVYYRIHLKNDKRSRLRLSVYGLIEAQNPSKELVTVMFKLANILGLKVYSLRLVPYNSVDDWEKRTRSYRQGFEQRRKKARIDFYFRIIKIWIPGIVLGSIAVYVLRYMGH